MKTSCYFHRLLLAAILLLPAATLLSQSVGIGTQTPSASAQFDVSSTTRGMLLPRMTTAQRNAIAAPAKGLLIYNLDDNSIDRYDGSRWQKENSLTTLDSTTAAGHPTPNSWVQRANAGSTPRNNAVAFTIANKGYMGTGSNSGTNLKDFWSYDPLTNAWTQLADFGGAARWRALGFAVGDNGYIGTGTLQGGSETDDFWEYNPATNQWSLKAAVPGGVRTWGVGFSLNGLGYAGLGLGKNDIYRYDPATNAWTALPTFPGGVRYVGTAFTLNGKAYVGLGLNGSFQGQSTIFPYDPATNTWGAAIATQPGLSGPGWSSFTLGNKAYVGMGNGSNSFFAYDPATNTWTAKAAYQGQGRYDGIAFAIGNKGYMGTGLNPSSPTFDFWEFMDDNKVPLASSLPAGTTGAVTDGAWTLDGGAVYKSSPGHVGIGTSNPTTPLDVNGKIKATTLQLTTGAAAGRLLQSDAGGVASWVDISSLSIPETDPQVGANTTNFLPKWNGTQLVSSMVQESGSTVGIGVTATPLMVVGLQVNASNSWIAGNFGNNNPNNDRVVIGNLAGKAVVGGHSAALNSWDTLLLNPGGGNVGIGTFAPAAALDVNGTVKAATLQLTTGAAAGRILQSDANGNASWVAPGIAETDPEVGANTTSFLSKWNGTQLVSSAVREDAGNVGINVAAAANGALQVNSAGISSSNWIAANLGSTAGNVDRVVLGSLNGVPTLGGHKNDFSAWSNLVINPAAAGNVGIGLNNPASKLHVNGTMRLGGQGAQFDLVYSQNINISAINNFPPTSSSNATFDWPYPISDNATIIVNPKGPLAGGIVIGHAYKSGTQQITVVYFNFLNNTAANLLAHSLTVTVINFN